MLLSRLFLALLLLTSTACAVIAPGPSKVGAGRYYDTGHPDYDEFFLRLYRLQIKLKDAPKRIGEPRQKVADALESGSDAEEIRVALAKRASELNGRGIRYSVARPESADKPPSLLVTGNPTGRDFELKGLLEGALKSAGELKIDVDAWQKELDELTPRETALESGVAEAFPEKSESERGEISSNLSDGQKIITLLVERTRDLDHATTDFLKALSTSLGETQVQAQAGESIADENGVTEKKPRKAPPPPKPAKATPAPKPAPKSKASPAPKASPPPKASPAPKPAAPPKAPKSSDASETPPAPKPTQGTAKPDFEP